MTTHCAPNCRGCCSYSLSGGQSGRSGATHTQQLTPIREDRLGVERRLLFVRRRGPWDLVLVMCPLNTR